jgi:hypothetical protein
MLSAAFTRLLPLLPLRPLQRPDDFVHRGNVGVMLAVFQPAQGFHARPPPTFDACIHEGDGFVDNSSHEPQGLTYIDIDAFEATF